MSQAPMSSDATSDDKLWAALAYVFTPLVPIILLLMQDKKDRPFIKAHNAQALAWGVVFYVIVTVTSFFLIGLCIWPLGLILIIYLIYKERSRYVAFHSLQAFVFQAICWFGGSALAIVSSLLSGVVPFIGLLCLPLACIFGILPVVALIYGTIGGIQVNQGQDFKYWFVGDWVLNTFMK